MTHNISFKISIHAPTRGATTTVADDLLRKVISIHAPTRGATLKNQDKIHKSYISIHAPTRGATERFHHFHV